MHKLSPEEARGLILRRRQFVSSLHSNSGVDANDFTKKASRHSYPSSGRDGERPKDKVVKLGKRNQSLSSTDGLTYEKFNFNEGASKMATDLGGRKEGKAQDKAPEKLERPVVAQELPHGNSSLSSCPGKINPAKIVQLNLNPAPKAVMGDSPLPVDLSSQESAYLKPTPAKKTKLIVINLPKLNIENRFEGKVQQGNNYLSSLVQIPMPLEANSSALSVDKEDEEPEILMEVFKSNSVSMASSKIGEDTSKKLDRGTALDSQVLPGSPLERTNHKGENEIQSTIDQAQATKIAAVAPLDTSCDVKELPPVLEPSKDIKGLPAVADDDSKKREFKKRGPPAVRRSQALQQQMQHQQLVALSRLRKRSQCTYRELTSESSSESSDGFLQCGECNKFCINPKQLKAHVNKYHPVNKEFRCHLCPWQCDRKTPLKLHFKMVHSLMPKEIKNFLDGQTKNTIPVSKVASHGECTVEGYSNSEPPSEADELKTITEAPRPQSLEIGHASVNSEMREVTGDKFKHHDDKNCGKNHQTSSAGVCKDQNDIAPKPISSGGQEANGGKNNENSFQNTEESQSADFMQRSNPTAEPVQTQPTLRDSAEDSGPSLAPVPTCAVAQEESRGKAAPDEAFGEKVDDALPPEDVPACDECGLEFANVKRLEIHWLTSHKKKGT